MITPAVSKRFHQSSATEILRDKLDNVMVKETDSRIDLHRDISAETHSTKDKTDEYTTCTEGRIIGEI